MKKKKVVVFGGAGFLGGYVVNELEKRNIYNVMIADILPSEYNRNTRFVKCDITNLKSVENVLAEGADYVYNFAGFSKLEDAIANPLETINLNVAGNLNILEVSKKVNCKNYIFASSAYAMSDKGSFYGISKLTSEKIIEEYKKKFGVNYIILRYGSVYSERSFNNNYIYTLINDAIKTGKIIHKGDGNEIREYIHAADAAKLSVDVLEDDKFLNQHLILTGSEKMQRKELFQMINEILGNTVDIQFDQDGYKDHYKYTPYSFQPTASKKLVNNPFIDMGQGILECIKQIKLNNESN